MGRRTIILGGVWTRQRSERVRPASIDRGRVGGGAILGGEEARAGVGRDRWLASAEQLEIVSVAVVWFVLFV